MDILDRSGILDRSVCCCLVYPCQAHRLAAGAVTCPYVTAALHRGIGTCSTLGRSNDGCRDYRWAAVSRRSCRPSESMACSITQPPTPAHTPQTLPETNARTRSPCAVAKVHTDRDRRCGMHSQRYVT